MLSLNNQDKVDLINYVWERVDLTIAIEKLIPLYEEFYDEHGNEFGEEFPWDTDSYDKFIDELVGNKFAYRKSVLEKKCCSNCKYYKIIDDWDDECDTYMCTYNGLNCIPVAKFTVCDDFEEK